MAWFSSIVNGVGSAANWLLSNSGLVTNLLKTVGTVAKGGFLGSVTDEGYVIVESVAIAEGDCDCGGDLTQDFKKATEQLEKKAREESNAPSVPPNGSQSSAVLSGLWTNPGLTLNGTATPEMYRDVAKFLAENNIPTELKTNKGNTVDVADSICATIFADVPGIPAPDDIRGVAIKFPTFNIPGAGCDISGTHAYYSIPLGKRSSGLACDDQAWHGAVQVTKTSTQAFDIEHKTKKQNLFFVSQDDEIADIGPYWVVTCQVDWRTTPLAEKAQEKVKEKIEDLGDGSKLLYSGVSGQNQTIKIHAPPKVTPPQVRAILNKVVTDIAKNVTKGGSKSFNKDSNVQPLTENMLSSQVRSVLNLAMAEAEKKLTGEVNDLEDGKLDPTLQTPEVTVTNGTLVA